MKQASQYNWFREALYSLPFMEFKKVKEKIIVDCGIDSSTFYRWVKAGTPHRKSDVEKTCTILNIEFNESLISKTALQ